MPLTLPSRDDLLIGGRFLLNLPRYLRRPVTLDEARRTLRDRLEHREADFLSVVRRAIFEYPASPYCGLLKHAGCGLGDLERLVREEGVEGALASLFRRGVFLTVDELKGRRPVTRGGTTLEFDPARLRNPLAAAQVPTRTGGSRGASSRVPTSFRYIRETSVNRLLTLDLRGGTAWITALWMAPAAGALLQVLRYSGLGSRPVRWFSPLDPSSAEIDPRYRWAARVLRWGSVLARAPLPGVEAVPFPSPLPVVHWMSGVLQSGRTPHLITSPSGAVLVCQAATRAGITLRGAQITTSSEPMTPARQSVIREAGARAVARYGTVEAGSVAEGCLAPVEADDLHLFHDLYALIQADNERVPATLPPRALLISCLRPTAPLLLLNVSLGDQAVIEARACGCPLERLGWTTHIHTIRSYEKLTAGGMTFLDVDVIRVLEEGLPARFGGGPMDYQLVETETDDGRPRLKLLVHPVIGALDEREVADTFLRGIAATSTAGRMMGLFWRESGFLEVERSVPRVTAAGKILHLHQARRSESSAR